jgi:hypothetical protein
MGIVYFLDFSQEMVFPGMKSRFEDIILNG